MGPGLQARLVAQLVRQPYRPWPHARPTFSPGSSGVKGSDLSAASHSHSCEITQSNPSLQSGMVQPVVNEMFATVHAAGSSLLGSFTSCSTFDSTARSHDVAFRLEQDNWEDTGKIFVFAKIFGRNCEDFRGVRLLGFWALGRHAVPSICTIGRR
eukprot:scaffold18704_cov108-Isochrysis_galbana.AAC.4